MRGVRQTSIPPSLEVTESAEAISSGEHRQVIRVSCDDLINDLARHLAAAYLAYQMDSSFNLVMRKYVEPHGQVGEIWKAAARFILDCQAADKPPTPGRQLVGAGHASGGNAA